MSFSPSLYHFALKIAPFVLYSIIFSNSFFFSSNWILVASFSLALLHSESICLCHMLIFFSSSSPSRKFFAFYVFAYLRVCSSSFHNKEAFTDLSFWYSSLPPSMVALIWFMFSVSDKNDVFNFQKHGPLGFLWIATWIVTIQCSVLKPAEMSVCVIFGFPSTPCQG